MKNEYLFIKKKKFFLKRKKACVRSRGLERSEIG